jgi:hypothetical protein
MCMVVDLAGDSGVFTNEPGLVACFNAADASPTHLSGVGVTS